MLNICKNGPKLNYGDLVILRGTVQVGLGQKLLVPLLERPGLNVKDFNYSFMPENCWRALFELKTLPQLISGKTYHCKEKALILLNFILKI